MQEPAPTYGMFPRGRAAHRPDSIFPSGPQNGGWTVDLTRRGRVRYITTHASLYLFMLCMTVVLSFGLVANFIELAHGRQVSGKDTFWGIIGLPLCLLFLILMRGRWVRQYPILRASRLEIELGTARMWSKSGTLLAEMKRARVDHPLGRDRTIWFRNEFDETDAFEVPLYMVCKS